jgi:hypothetical protein
MTDCLTANDTSIKLRTTHKLRAARAQALVCASPSCPAEVRDACEGRVKDVNAATPTLVWG